MEDRFVPNFDLIMTNYHYLSSQNDCSLSTRRYSLDIYIRLYQFMRGQVNPESLFIKKHHCSDYV
jgi:hypothetical protein